MKNKKAVYVLLPLVALIWGIIIYRVFSSVGDASDNDLIGNNSLVKPAGNIAPDTFTIVASYRDPFLGKAVADPLRSENQTVPVAPKKPPVAVPVTWPFVAYKGMIKNQKLNKQLGMVQVGGEDNLVKPGDVIQGVKITKLYRDSAEVEFQKEKKTVKKQL